MTLASEHIGRRQRKRGLANFWLSSDDKCPTRAPCRHHGRDQLLARCASLQRQFLARSRQIMSGARAKATFELAQDSRGALVGR
jgi:hypothetical protein